MVNTTCLYHKIMLDQGFELAETCSLRCARLVCSNLLHVFRSRHSVALTAMLDQGFEPWSSARKAKIRQHSTATAYSVAQGFVWVTQPLSVIHVALDVPFNKKVVGSWSIAKVH